MASDSSGKVKVKSALIAPVRHPIKAAALLYTPPSIILHGPIYMIFVISFGALAYSFWATIDETIATPLTLVRESTTVESVGSGMVVDLGAHANSETEVGDVLVQVQEQTRISADTEQSQLASRKYELEKDLDKAQDEYQNRITQLELDLANFDTNRVTQKKSLEGRIKQIKNQLATARNTKRREQGRLATVQKQYKRKKALYDSRDITVSEFEAVQERLNDVRKGVDDASSTIAKVRVDLTTAEGELAKLLDLKGKQKLELELEQTKHRLARDTDRFVEQIQSAERRMQEGQKLVEGVTFDESTTQYSSKFNGLITDVHVRKGQIITPGTPLVTIVRDTAPLMARVLVQNENIGRLNKGQDVKIKYYAYPYQEYGIREGVIVSIATKPGGVTGFETMYVVMVALKSEVIKKSGSKREKTLEIGLEGLADIKTGTKRLIEVVFRPASKFFAGEEDDG